MGKYKNKIVNAIEPRIRNYTETRGKWKQIGKTSKKSLGKNPGGWEFITCFCVVLVVKD